MDLRNWYAMPFSLDVYKRQIFGCMSQFLKNRLVQRVPGAQIVIGTSNIEQIPQYLSLIHI